MRYLLDTNTCIYIINNNPLAVRERFLQVSHDDIGLSSIVVGELVLGVAKSTSPRARPKLQDFLATLHVVEFDDVAAWRWGELRAHLQSKGKPIGPYDTQIAAHALALDCTLVTNNLREFERVPGLKLENWID
ncbi:MAG: type II toxin-antitoxin system VapC family toxin [Uliginosibacterium sp.]|nr:type II toxin-antitoxin system VapC family toxin [Uliginosibacterium sp.]